MKVLVLFLFGLLFLSLRPAAALSPTRRGGVLFITVLVAFALTRLSLV